MSQVILEGKQVGKTFTRNHQTTEVLKQVDIQIFDKDFTVIMGSSGAGKSTLLYTLSGMDVCSSGQIQYRGKDVSNLREKEQAELRARAYGFVFQQTHLVGNLSLRENIAVSGYIAGKHSPKEIDERAEALLERMKIAHVADHAVSQVSGGEAQRAAIARAIIAEPDILFADEPTGALNRAGSENVLDIFTELHQAGQSIVMVTHDVHAAIRANRILYLDDGRLVGEYTFNPYSPKEGRAREDALNAWLLQLHW